MSKIEIALSPLALRNKLENLVYKEFSKNKNNWPWKKYDEDNHIYYPNYSESLKNMFANVILNGKIEFRYNDFSKIGNDIITTYSVYSITDMNIISDELNNINKLYKALSFQSHPPQLKTNLNIWIDQVDHGTINIVETLHTLNYYLK